MHHTVLTALLLAWSFLGHLPGWAQEPSGPRPVQPSRPLALPTLQPAVADTGIFSAVPFPQPNELRRPDGSPGREYWQQRVDYTIKVALDTADERITGTVSIR